MGKLMKKNCLIFFAVVGLAFALCATFIAWLLSLTKYSLEWINVEGPWKNQIHEYVQIRAMPNTGFSVRFAEDKRQGVYLLLIECSDAEDVCHFVKMVESIRLEKYNKSGGCVFMQNADLRTMQKGRMSVSIPIWQSFHPTAEGEEIKVTMSFSLCDNRRSEIRIIHMRAKEIGSVMLPGW